MEQKRFKGFYSEAKEANSSSSSCSFMPASELSFFRRPVSDHLANGPEEETRKRRRFLKAARKLKSSLDSGPAYIGQSRSALLIVGFRQRETASERAARKSERERKFYCLVRDREKKLLKKSLNFSRVTNSSSKVDPIFRRSRRNSLRGKIFVFESHSLSSRLRHIDRQTAVNLRIREKLSGKHEKKAEKETFFLYGVRNKWTLRRGKSAFFFLLLSYRPRKLTRIQFFFSRSGS